MLRANDILDGKYRIERLLGQGGMGRVFLAQNLKVGNYWAIKEIDLNQHHQINLLAEPEILKKINHHLLPRIIDIITSGNYLYIVEDYFEGSSLKELIGNRKICTEENIVKWAKQLCEILIYLHGLQPNPIIYRDMKPANIIIDSNLDVRLIDFGIAREYKKGQQSDTSYIGTRGYAAPEQYGTQQTDERTDIYGLGATLYHVATGKGPNDPPYEMVPVRQLNSRLSEGLEAVISRCVKNDPAARYRSARELLDGLDNMYKLNREYRRARLKKRLIIAAVLVGVLSAAGVFIEVRHQQEVEKITQFNKYIDEGTDYYKQGEYQKAEASFNNALLINPDENDVYINIAKVYLRRNENEKIAKYLTDAINQGHLNSSNPEVNYLLGTAYFNLGDYRKSIFHFKTALDGGQGGLGALYSDVQRDLAVSYGRAGDLQNAENILSEIASKGSDDHVALYVRGELYAIKHEYDKAIPMFEQACLMDTGNIRYKQSLAQAYLNSNNLGKSYSEKVVIYQKAINVLSEAEAINPNNIVIMSLTANTLYDLGLLYDSQSAGNGRSMYQQSLTKYNKLIDLGIKDVTTYVNKGIMEDKLGSQTEAENSFREALKTDGNSSSANLLYGLFKLKNKEYDEASKYFSKTVELNKDPSDVAIARSKINELKEKGWIN